MSYGRPRLVDGGGRRTDLRVQAVLEVLAGEGVGDVARRREVDVAVLHRWVTAFVDAGTAQVTNQPDPDAEQQRDRFLAAFAHETRTPLATARGWVDLLIGGDVPPRMLAATLTKLDDSLTRLAERARDVELLASASLGLLRPRVVEVSLGGLTVGLPAAVVREPDGRLVADPDLMGRIVRDLHDAARLPPDPVEVRIELHRTGPWSDLRVVRLGPPLEHSTLQTLFEPFDLNDDGSGITIGLYLARALAVTHGGAVGVDQDEQSTTFWVRVPERPTGEGPVGDHQEP